MDIKMALRQLRSEKKEINELRLLRERKVSMLTSGAMRYDKPRVKSSPEDMMLKLGSEIADIDAAISRHINHLIEREKDCITAINLIERSDYRRLLYMRYIDDVPMTWDEIADELGYSERSIRRKHGIALNEARKHWRK